MSRITRRGFLAAGVGGIAAGSARWLEWGTASKEQIPIPGQILGASAAHGHRLRGGGFPEPSRTEEVDVVVAGGGIAGLAAARQLQRLGCEKIVLLELESAPGGNAACGANATSAYPWGAHYVPLPNPECRDVIALFEELGVITGWSEGAPIYEETMLCGDPGERLFLHGRWQEGLIPQLGISNEDRKQYDRFFAEMERCRLAQGTDGRFAFTIPLDQSSQDSEWLALDNISMAVWLDQQGYSSSPLRWYIDYACRDDFGAGINHVSAWAGIHYFASRRGTAANAAREAVLTWPEGNGWIAGRMAASLGGGIRSQSLIWRIEQQRERVAVDYLDVATGASVRILARAAVCAMPYFVAQRVVKGATPVSGLEYSPWMVANITLNTLPTGRGAALAWDNVMRDSASLGYIVATHQNLNPFPRRTVLTHYWPLDHTTPQQARQEALAKSHGQWCEQILADLERVHYGIRKHVEQIDVWLWGHGMIRPVPGLIWSGSRARMSSAVGNIFFAHSDLSGMSLFEEAYTRGVHAARSLWQSIA